MSIASSPLLTELTESQQDLRAMVAEFAQREVAPLAAQIDRTATFPSSSWKRLAELGLLAVSAPEEFGGTGRGVVETCVIAEELTAACLSTAIAFAHQANLVVYNLGRNASAELAARWLPGLCDGSITGCLAITEPEAGSDALSMRTTAIEVDGGWLLNGSKTFITNAPVADMTMVYVRHADTEGRRSLSLMIVPTDSPGLERSAAWDKVGWRGSPTGALTFTDCFVPVDSVVGEVGDGIRILMSGLNAERLTLAATGIGLARAALEAATEYARSRRQFGRPIGEFQLVRGMLADISAGIEANRALSYSGARLADRGHESEIGALAASAKLLSSELAVKAALDAVQIFGGNGYMTDFPVERLMRDAKMLTIGGGTSEIQRHIIAKSMIGF